MVRTKVTRKQLVTLHTLYSRSPRSVAADGELRATRLAWGSSVAGRQLASFGDLSSDEAAALIDALKTELGQPITPKPARKRREISSSGANVLALATPNDLRSVHFWREQSGMSAAEFDAWLQGAHSPTRGRKLLTRRACRAVVTALRAMVRRSALKRAG